MRLRTPTSDQSSCDHFRLGSGAVAWMMGAFGLLTGCIEVKKSADVAVADVATGTDAEVTGEDALEVTGEDALADTAPTDAEGPETDVAPPECSPERSCDDRASEACTDWTCNDGKCVEVQLSEDVRCIGPNVCMTYACNAGKCEETPVGDGADCDDGDFCNGVAQCESGACVVGPTCEAVEIRADGCISSYLCDEASRTCVPEWKGPSVESYLADGHAEGVSCIALESGLAGSCVAGMCVPEGMQLVPAGTSRMGCNMIGMSDLIPGCQATESPAHSVRLGVYAIDAAESTLAAWKACVRDGHDSNSGKCAESPIQAGATVPTNASVLPVRFLTWSQAHALCDHAGKRLCTEAEWERAARGEAANSAYVFPPNPWPWGLEEPTCDRARFRVDSGCNANGTGPVEVNNANYDGASPYGVLHMAGNVAEWVADGWDANAYQGRAGSVAEAPFVQPELNTLRILRGGHFLSFDLLDIATFRRTAATPDLSETDGSVWQRGARCCSSILLEPAIQPPPPR